MAMLAAVFPLTANLGRLHWGWYELAMLRSVGKFQSVGFGKDKKRKILREEWRNLVER